MRLNNYIYFFIIFTYSICSISIGLSFFDSNASPSNWTIYTSAIIFFINISLVLKFKQYISKSNKFKNMSLIFFISYICIIAGAVRANYEYSNRDIWVDEVSQFERSTFQVHGKDITTDAAVEQQPPLHYYLNYLSYKIFKFQKVAPRFITLLYYFFLCFLLPFVSYYFTHSKFITATIPLILVSSYQISFYSIEGRPFLLTVFFGFIYLAILYNRIINSSQESSYNPEEHNHSRLLTISSGILLVLTVSIQPVLLMISVVIPQIIILKKKEFLKLFIDHILIALLTSPVLYIIYTKSKHLNQFKEKLTFPKFIEHFNHNIEELWYFTYNFNKVYLLFLVTIVTLTFIAKKKKEYFARFLVPNLLLPITLIVFMTIFINWNIYHRYYIIINSLMLITLILLAHQFKKNLLGKVFLMIYIGTMAYDTNRSFDAYYSKFQHRISNEQVYTFFSQFTKANDVALFLNFNYLGQWRGDYWVANKFYYGDKFKKAILLKKNIMNDTIPFIDPKLIKAGDSPIDVFILQRFNWNKVFLHRSYQEFGLQYVRNFKNDYNIFKVTIDSIKQWKTILRNIKQKVPEHFRFSTLEALIYYAVKERNQSEFEALIEEYKNTDPYPEDMTDFKNNGYILDMKAEKLKRVKSMRESWIRGY